MCKVCAKLPATPIASPDLSTSSLNVNYILRQFDSELETMCDLQQISEKGLK